MKKSKRHHEDEHEEAHSEGWLVSYADMMTLLFGLFVMLYTLSVEKQGKFEDSLSEVSASMASRSPDSVPEVKPAPPPLPEIDPALELQQQVDLQKNLIDKLQSQTFEMQEKITEQNRVIERNKEDSERLAVEKTTIEQRLQELEAKKVQMESQISEVQLEKEKMVNKFKKTQNLNNLEVQNREQTQAEIKRKEQLIKEKELKLSQNNQTLDQVKAELAAKSSEIAELQQALKQAEAETKGLPQHLMFVLKWQTDRHDLDMVVIDPNGKKFDFKKREYSNYQGKFTLDSRSGPGAEIWQSEKLVPGEYKVMVNFYQEYNNKENAKFYLQVNSSRDSKDTDQIELSFSAKKRELRFSVSAKGDIKIL